MSTPLVFLKNIIYFHLFKDGLKPVRLEFKISIYSKYCEIHTSL